MSLRAPSFSELLKNGGKPFASENPVQLDENGLDSDLFDPPTVGVKALREAQIPRPTLWVPQPGPQTLAFTSPADIVGFGGSAGGGKSDLLLGVAISHQYRSIIFRREYGQLEDLVGRAKELTEGNRKNFVGAPNYVLTMNHGATVKFGAMQHPDDWVKYKGRPHDLKGYDEATELAEIQVRNTMAWTRSSRRGQRCRVIMTFNPPSSPEGEWVTRFYSPWLDPHHPRPAQPGELRWYAQLEDEFGKTVEVEVADAQPFLTKDHDGKEVLLYPLSRTFIPARLSDNKFLAEDGEYERMLQATPEPLRSQLLFGSFRASKEANQWQVVPTAWVEAAMARGRAKQFKPEGSVLSSMGVDVAHGGNDKTVICKRYGNWFAPLIKTPGALTPTGKKAADLVILEHQEGAAVNVDAIGWGASCAEVLANTREDGGFGLEKVYAVNVATQSDYRDKSGRFAMRNVRAEMYWRVRELLDPDNGHDACLPSDRELLADLCAHVYKLTPSGIQVESKEDLKARIGRSPDCGDAFALSLLNDLVGRKIRIRVL